MWKRILLWLGKAIVQAAAEEAAKKFPGGLPAQVPPATVRDVLRPPTSPDQP